MSKATLMCEFKKKIRLKTIEILHDLQPYSSRIEKRKVKV